MRAALVVFAVLGLAACGRAEARPGVRVVDVDVHYSRYSISRLAVRPGETVRFVVHNRDPIDHELIVGDAGVQDRHEQGTEPRHGLRPGEITIPAGTTAVTQVTFPSTPVPLFFGCHLPGHWAYGMHGTIAVR